MTDTQAGKEEIRKNIVELFEIAKLPEDQQEETLSKIGQIIFQAVLIRVLPLLSEEDLEAYDKLMSSGPGVDQVLDFFFEKVPAFSQIVAEETENFRKESEEMLGKIK